MWMHSLKEKVIYDYKKMLKSLFIGKSYNYDKILDMINFIEVNEYIDNSKALNNLFING